MVVCRVVTGSLPRGDVFLSSFPCRLDSRPQARARSARGCEAGLVSLLSAGAAMPPRQLSSSVSLLAERREKNPDEKKPEPYGNNNKGVGR